MEEKNNCVERPETMISEKDLLRDEIEMLHDKLCKAEEKIDYLENVIDIMDVEVKGLKLKIERQDGIITGLKFALRCNGISGGDVE